MKQENVTYYQGGKTVKSPLIQIKEKQGLQNSYYEYIQRLKEKYGHNEESQQKYFKWNTITEGCICWKQASLYIR